VFGSKSGREGRAAARSHTVSVHVTSSVSGRTFHRTFSWWVVRALIGAGGGLVLVVVVGICGLFGWIGSKERMYRLQAENDSLRVQFRRLGELEANLARMSELNEQMHKMLGVGVPTMETDADSPAAGRGATGGPGQGSPGDSSEDPGGDGVVHPGRTGDGPPRREAGSD
jgi:hypothetical protein